jgi:hypothetical protein
MAEYHELAGGDGELYRISPADIATSIARQREAVRLAINGVVEQLDAMHAFTDSTLHTAGTENDQLVVATLPLSIFERSAAVFVNRIQHSADPQLSEERCDSLLFVINADKPSFAGRALGRMVRQDHAEPWPWQPGLAYILVDESTETATVSNGFNSVNVMLDDEMKLVAARYVLSSIAQYQQHLSRITPHPARRDGVASVTLGK